MKIAQFNNNPTLEDALAAVDGLRKDIESGKIISFVAVGVSSDDATIGYCGSSRPVSKLRVTGALFNTLRAFDGGEFGG